MTLPIIMIFERHSDVTPNLLLKNMLPKLAKQGYNTLCQELPSSLSEQEILTDSNEQICCGVKLMRLFNLHADKTKIPNGRLSDCTAEELGKALPSNFPASDTTQLIMAAQMFPAKQLRHDILQYAKKQAFSIMAIDDPTSVEEVCSAPNHLHGTLVIKTLQKRDSVMADALFHLHIKNKAIIVQLGGMHFKGVFDQLKEKGLTDNDIVCYFPYSCRFSDMKFLYECGQILINKTIRATTNEEIALLGQKILAEVKSKVIKNNCHIQFLSDFFKVNFRPQLRPEYRLDALLPIEQMKDSIRPDLDDLGIKYRVDQNYLVIPDVNTTEIGHRIRLLPYKV